MATAAPSPLASSVEKTNGAKLSRLLIDGGTTVLRKVFDGFHPPATLAADLNACYSTLNNLLRRKILNRHQWDQLFPPGGAAPDSSTFDITLLFLLLTTICGLSPPPSGWHKKPPPSDTSREANLARVKYFRNVLYGHVSTTGVDTPTFNALWQEISASLVALGLNQDEMDRLKAERGGEEDYLDALLEWADSEEDIKSQLKNIHHTQSQTQQTIEDFLETQTKAKQAIEEVFQIQTKTQQIVKEHYDALQAGLRQLKEAVDSSKEGKDSTDETQTKAKQAIEEFSQIQTKTQQTVEEHYEALQAGLRQVKEAVDSFKEGKDSTDEVLRNLAKSEFKGDIKYYLERFQTDTREWVFNRVQNWMDDRNTQNRVMVISGNAGMGKSVIAAVICQRMQEASRLSGNHFFQHDNSRYQKPQLMLQSLASHFSRTLPEYKQELVKQLSRNLGLDLNSMSVEELFSVLFKEVLNTVGYPGRNMLMVIEGLDKSECEGRNELLDVFANQFCKLPSWVRLLVTTRPVTNIMEKLKHLKPFQLAQDDEKNVEDIRVVLQKRLQRVIKSPNVDAVVEKLVVKQQTVKAVVEWLVLKSEGLMLYAHFLMLYIEENPSVLNKADLDRSLPLGIYAVYSSYFKRLELELKKELGVKEEDFLNLLCAVTASRGPLPLDFVSILLVPTRNSPLTAISSVSSLLPIRDGCLHVIHKSVIDWMTDSACYGKHDFFMDEKEGNRILANLCTGELDDLKRRGVHNVEFSATEKYALCHGARHLLQSHENDGPHRMEELTKAYVVDLELVFAKLRLNSFSAAEDVVWLQKHGISTILSEDIQSNLDTLLFLLRKHYNRLTSHPHLFLQTVLNEGGTVLSSQASNLLQNKYPEIPYMEYVHKETQQGGVVACFECFSDVVCFDVSPSLDYMVCECYDGMLQLWSLQTGRRLWERPVQVPKSYQSGLFRISLCRVRSFYRSVVFHPTEDLVLPGVLSHAYTLNGDLKLLFLQSDCRFSVCSISADKTKLLTNCSENAKCLVMWSLDNGSEIARITRDEDVLSFAWSRDGRLLAISHSTGLISLVDVMREFTTVAETTTSPVCKLLKFTPDSHVLFLSYSEHFDDMLQCSVVEGKNRSVSLQVSSRTERNDSSKFESFSDCGFLLGDLFPTEFKMFTFVINKHVLLRISYMSSRDIEMINTNDVTNGRQSVATEAQEIALSLDGQTVYIVSDAVPPIFLFCTLMAWDVSSRKLRGEKPCERTIRPCPVRRGVLLSSRTGTLELWRFDLSECIQQWINLTGITKVIPISDERVACVTKGGEVIILDTSSGEILSTISTLHRQVVTCNSKLQIISIDEGVLQLSEGAAVLWKKWLPHGDLKRFSVMFSPGEQFLIFWEHDFLSFGNVRILDAASGNILNVMFSLFVFKFLSDDECVVYDLNHRVVLCNPMSGDELIVINVDDHVTCLAACPSQCLVAFGLLNSSPNFKVIRVWLPGDKDGRKSER